MNTDTKKIKTSLYLEKNMLKQLKILAADFDVKVNNLIIEAIKQTYKIEG